MKVGDQMVVRLENFDVAMATIEHIEDGKATILIPATRIVMGVRQELAPLNPEVDRIFAGTTEPKGTNESDASGVHDASESLAQQQTNESGPTPQSNSSSVSEANPVSLSEQLDPVPLAQRNFDTSALDRE